jgi:hypothetical protein
MAVVVPPLAVAVRITAPVPQIASGLVVVTDGTA